MNSFENTPGEHLDGSYSQNNPEFQAPQQPPQPQAPVQNPAPSGAYQAPAAQQSQGSSYQQPQSGAYHQVPPYSGWQGDPVPPRRQSPYADSPYMNGAPQQDTWGNPTYAPKQKAPKKPRKPKGDNPWSKRILAGVLALALVAAGSGITALCLNNHWNTVLANIDQENENRISALEAQIKDSSRDSIISTPAGADGALTPSQVYAKNVSSVVAISSTMGENALGQVATGSGSGFILSSDGYVATNCHVVEGAHSISVLTGDDKEYPAKLLGKDPSNDVAILKIEAEGLPAVTIGNSNDLLIGDMVVAIGNPLGELTATQTVGYICGKDRTVTTGGTAINMLQTDAAINPGNSGGPLFNMKGEVIGITTAKYSGTTGSGASIEGIGFAIPIDDVLGIMKDLAVHGYVTGPYLGVSVRDVDPQIASTYNIPLGAYIVEVVEGFSADKAGLQPKDIVTRMDSYDIRNSNDLIRALRHFEAGDTVTVTFNRAGAEKTAELTLDEKPQQQTTPTADQQPVPQPGDEDYDEFMDAFNKFFGDFFGFPMP